MTVLVLLSVFAVVEALSVVIPLAAWRWRPEPTAAVKQCSVPTEMSVIIPVLGALCDLETCLKSVRVQPLCLEVLVILQDPGGEHRALVKGCIGDAAEVKLVELKGEPSKARAIRLALTQVRPEWVLPVDSDTMLFPGAMENLLHAANEHDAAYGVIIPRSASESSLLHRAVQLEKLLSHGLWRLGRWVLSVGPKLCGQCYLARFEVLRAVYREYLGYLDDAAMSGWLLAKGFRLNLAPMLVASKAGRATWAGLLFQRCRCRYSIGLLQTFMAVDSCGGYCIWAWLCLLIHAWVYYGSCISAVGLTILCLAAGWWGGAAILVSSFVAERFIFACLAVSTLGRLGVPKAAVWPGWLLLPSVVVLALVKTHWVPYSGRANSVPQDLRTQWRLGDASGTPRNWPAPLRIGLRGRGA
jgi:cellulose synthase/poly-beta-1,6-N-acetylglucosamine synthase-like glycosyltransferase